jgi:hypothetical protein
MVVSVRNKEYEPTHHVPDNDRDNEGGPYPFAKIRQIVREKARPQPVLPRDINKKELIEIWKQQDRFILAYGGRVVQNTAELTNILGRADLLFETIPTMEGDIGGPTGIPAIALCLS